MQSKNFILNAYIEAADRMQVVHVAPGAETRQTKQIGPAIMPIMQMSKITPIINKLGLAFVYWLRGDLNSAERFEFFPRPYV